MDSTSNYGTAGVRRLDVVETGRRRRWSAEAKQRIVEETLEEGTSVLAVARRYEIAPTQLYAWRARLCRRVADQGGAIFAPVVVTPEAPSGSLRGRMEVVSSNGRRIIVDSDVDVAALIRLLAGLER
jgi:transposase